MVSHERIVYRLYNCPFLEMALRYPAEVCDNLEERFRIGLAQAFSNLANIDRLKCIAHNDQFCEFVCECVS